MIENTITESVDYNKLTQLARYGLVDKSNVQKLIAAFKKMEDGKALQPAQRELMLSVLTDLTSIVTGDSQMFMKAKKAVSEDALIDEKYDTPVKKKPVSMMSKAEKDKNDERRKSYKEFQKSLRKEDTQIDEISMTKMAAYAPKAVKSRNDAKAATHSADSNRVANAKKVIAKRKAGADNYNKKMWGYANVAPTKESVELDEKSPAIKQDNIKVIRTADKAHSDAMGRTPAGRKKPTKAPVVEAKVGPSHDEIMKAIGNTQSSAQGMAILQKKFKLTAAQARKHMDMFLKDDVNEAKYSDTGWKKPEVKKDKFGNVIKDKNVAKNLAKSAMKSFKDIRKK